ncbi:MAG: 2Fe-2S iron-sulfur cluster binding domain-containing protein [Alphaproteobacteria bacterium]|nr:2Fe-2S iron-sulfur cluster binding domain-containing protein [Alphaproteobacteria bacterium]
MPTIHVTDRSGAKQTIDGKVGQTVMEILRDKNIDVEAICGGCCSCATCHVFVDDAWAAKLPARSEDEQELVEETESYKAANSRLSCQIKFTPQLDGLSLTVALSE